jgi:hypothetical protein
MKALVLTMLTIRDFCREVVIYRAIHIICAYKRVEIAGDL